MNEKKGGIDCPETKGFAPIMKGREDHHDKLKTNLKNKEKKTVNQVKGEMDGEEEELSRHWGQCEPRNYVLSTLPFSPRNRRRLEACQP